MAVIVYKLKSGNLDKLVPNMALRILKKIPKLKKTTRALTIFEISFKYGYNLENCRGQNIPVILII